MSVSGTLFKYELPTALELLSRAKSTGILTISGEKGIATVALREGGVLFASSHNTPRLGEFLVDKGIVDANDLEAVLKHQRRKKVATVDGRAQGAIGAKRSCVGVKSVDSRRRNLPEHFVEAAVVRCNEPMVAGLCQQDGPIRAHAGIGQHPAIDPLRQQQAADISPARRYAMSEVDHAGQRTACEDTALHNADIGVEKSEVRGQRNDWYRSYHFKNNKITELFKV